MKKKKVSARITKQLEQAAKKEEEEEEEEEEVVEDINPANELLHALAIYQMLLQRVRLDPRYSDLTIECRGDEHAVHKCIVCPRSAFLAKVCDSGLQARHQWGRNNIPRVYCTVANSIKESSTNRATLQEEPRLVKGLIEYFYYLDYEVQPHCPDTDVFIGLDKPTPDTETDADVVRAPSEPKEDLVATFDPLSIHISMYSLADRMFIEGLKVLSKKKFIQELDQRVNTEIFPYAITQIYNSTHASDRGLRDIAVKATMDNLQQLRTAPYGHVASTATSVFTDSLLKEIPQFCYDLAVAMMEKTVSDWRCYGYSRKNWISQ
ncbi:uncharacterized protein N7479_008348 [Penicillium vulpinum]|uniref:uncharacterized protein n=1 Tax=Penicillium vulpinum TaxID=29845 RepID=UPI0025493AC4|nr:uncharacterized protein N7479_008348 [Penicillium vulpinum]KAJ5961198.1 hypothetical protein N7479_008348 [Penicillium vulpinum]